MSQININNFGNLTINGKNLKFEDFDKNSDGKISAQEYNSLLNELKLDSVDFANIDDNGDKDISKEEFSIWEQKILMQEAVNSLSIQISSDFSGKSEYLEELTKQLKALINDYAKTFYGNVSVMAEEFKKELPEKYEQIKQSILENDPSSISAEVIFEISQGLTQKYANQDVPENFITRVISELNKEATRFIQNYNGDDLQWDLQMHLETFLNTSDSDSMKDAIIQFQEKTSGYGTEDLDIIKEQAKILLQAAIDKGITLNIAGKNILTDVAITNVLMMFDSAETLLNEINNAISKLNTEPRLLQYLREEQEKAVIEAEKKFTDINGSEYNVKADLIDWNQVDSRYFEEDGKIHERGKGWDGSKEKAYDEGFKILTSDGLKNQIKTQVETMLQEKGVPFERIAQIFENVYNQSAQDTLNAEGMITGRGARGLSKKGHAYINVKNLCDTFVSYFNTNITKSIEEMNKSNTDFDTIDLDYSAMNTNEYGCSVAENGEDFAALYASGQNVIVKKKGADYYVKIAEKLIDNMKSQILAKAQAMCVANGVEFDESAFEEMFKNAKDIAVDCAVKGCDKKGRNWAGTGASAALGAAAGVGALAAATTTTAAVVGYSAATITILGVENTIMIPVVGTVAVTGPVGWIVGGALLLGGILAGIFCCGGDKSQSLLNTKVLMDTFTEQFKANYTAWVEQQKTGDITQENLN